MIKTFTQQVLERAEKATPGPWTPEYGVSMRSAWSIENPMRRVALYLDGTKNIALDEETSEVEENLEFIAHSRTDLVEACKRLERAIEELKVLTQYPNELLGETTCKHLASIIRTLERPLE